MKGYKVGFYVMTAAFAASLAYQFTSSPEASVSSDPSTDTRDAPETEPPDTPHPKPTVDDLRAQLSECRESSWELVAKAMNQGDDETSASEPAQDDDDPQTSHLERQRDALTQVALEHLAASWKTNRANIIKAMAHVGKQEWVSADIDKKVAGHARRFDLNRHDTARLERGYGQLWGEYGDNMQGLIQNKDWEGLMDEVRSFWRDEDRMIGNTLGQEQRSVFRKSDTRHRTTIMAILAIFAGVPWDENIGWQ